MAAADDEEEDKEAAVVIASALDEKYASLHGFAMAAFEDRGKEAYTVLLLPSAIESGARPSKEEKRFPGPGTAELGPVGIQEQAPIRATTLMWKNCAGRGILKCWDIFRLMLN